MLSEAARRLGWLGLLYAGFGFVGHFGERIIIAGGSLRMAFRAEDLFFVAAAIAGIALYVASRRGEISPARLLDAGLVFYVACAFGIAVGRAPGSMHRTADVLFGLLPAECLWIVVYPLVVPTPPKRMLVASLLAASAGPLAFALPAVVSDTPVDRADLLFFFTNYLCAGVAYTVSRIVHRVSMRLKQAREIGSYALVEKIGEGGMGEVWRAKHRLLARPAAIKLIRADAIGMSDRSHDAALQRFEREAQDTATLGSVHTVNLYDFGVTQDGDFYYVMELLEGLSLEQFVKKFGPMEPGRAVYALRQACHSLAEAHARGLIHRDIKPANIFLCRLGPDEDFVKVLDFGLVKHVAAGETVAQLTMEGALTGTPAFLPPEIAMGTAFDERADIYALGCVAYYLLTGELVFSRETPMAMALAHVSEVPRPPSERSEVAIPPLLDALILQCLAKDPAGRPASAFELASRLAATVPADAWTDDHAHQWWQLHWEPPASTPPPDVVEEDASRRCWPRFERDATVTR
jgi:serine/threonine-protein kinase